MPSRSSTRWRIAMSHVTAEAAARLLVIDDDARVQILMKALFRRRGVVVDCAGDGASALDRLWRVSYDVVMLDLTLPRPNGFAVIRELKSRDIALLGRTIVVTAADATLREFADRRLVRRVMQKPFDVDELLAEVLALTHGVPAHRPVPAFEQHVH